MSTPTRSHRRGKAVHDNVLAAAVNELLNVGFDGVTVSSVAETAGVHVTSVYRRWRSKEQLLTDALLNHVDPAGVDVPDTGDIRSDLVELLANLTASLAAPANRALLRLAAVPVELDRLDDARKRILDIRTASVGTVLRRAIERGEIDADLDHRVALEAIFAPVYARVLLTHEPVDDTFIAALVDLFLHGMSTRTAPAGTAHQR